MLLVFWLNARRNATQRENKVGDGARAPHRAQLFSQIKSIDHVFVTVCCGSFEIIEQFSAARHHLQQPAPGGMILDVILEVIRELINPAGKERYLNIRTARVIGMHPKRLNFLSIGHI